MHDILIMKKTSSKVDDGIYLKKLGLSTILGQKLSKADWAINDPQKYLSFVSVTLRLMRTLP